MQSILDIKLKMETQAKQEFAQAKNVLDREEAKLEMLYNRKEEYEAYAKQLLKGKLDVQEINQNNVAIMKTQEAIDEQKKRVAKAQQFLEKAREKLQEVVTERKVQESLKEKAFEAFLQEEKQQESKEIDQLTSYTYGQKIQSVEKVSVEY
jgi:flagellar FliJ protein